jgi:hypothetical protein
MVKNIDVVKEFLNNRTKTKTKHLYIERNNNGVLILYSYGSHFPLCIKLLDNTFLINIYSYSNTTARHKGLLCRELVSDTFKGLQKNKPDFIMFFDTDKLKAILNKGFNTQAQIIEDRI